MKKLSLALMLTGMLFSCKKENAPMGEQVKKPVTIRIPEFTTSHENIRVNADSSLAGITDLYYLSYNSAWQIVHEMHQDSTDPNFGTFTDSLAPGDYQIVVIASQQPLQMHPLPGSTRNDYFDPGFAAPNIWNPYKDVFHTSQGITVPATGNPGVIDVNLHRIIGKVEVKILDALPANHPNGFIDVYFVNPPAKVYIESGTALNPVQNTLSWFTRRNQFLFDAFMFGIDDSFEVRIDYKDKNTGAPLQKVIPTILIWQNQKTIIQGYLYGAPVGNDFQIKLNQAWGTDSTVVNFN